MPTFIPMFRIRGCCKIIYRGLCVCLNLYFGGFCIFQLPVLGPDSVKYSLPRTFVGKIIIIENTRKKGVIVKKEIMETRNI
jgi:hypothetical protein